MYNEDSNNGNSGNNGHKGKFRERLQKIRKERLNFKNETDANKNEFFLLTFGRNILKITLALPSVVYSNIVIKGEKEKKKHEKNAITNEDNISNNSLINNKLEYDDNVFSKINYSENVDKRIKISKIKDIDISLLKKQREYYKDNKTIIDNKENIEIQRIQKQIINLIKKKLINNINELEILQSELYILNQMRLGDNYLNECQHDIKEIKKLLLKINSLKEKYNYLKNNVDFEYMLEYDDNLLIDKILELKEICSKEDVKKIVDNYKILNEYKYLYLKIDKLEEDTIKLQEYKDNKVKELKDRDIDFEELKNKIYSLDNDNEKYINFVNKQDLFLRVLEEKISKIDSYERVTYRLKGFNQLLGNSFKYLGLLLINPLKGVVPGIVSQTLITKNVVKNLYNNLEWQENKKMVYEAIDYSSSIKNAINDLSNTSSLIDTTLEDIILLKEKYKKEFSKYENSFSEYNEAIKKLNKIENSVLNSKIKLGMIQTRMKEKEKINDNKLKKVKELNNKN